jgi:hypothetical protein
LAQVVFVSGLCPSFVFLGCCMVLVLVLVYGVAS